MVVRVTDSSGNKREKIANAAEFLSRSKDRQKVFDAIYRGKKRKTVKEIADITGMSEVRVAQEANKLYHEDIVLRSETLPYIYEKDGFYSQNKRKILSLAQNKTKLNKFPTKSNPVSQVKTVIVKYNRSIVNRKFISVDDVDTFSKVRRVKSVVLGPRLYESKLKDALKAIIGEPGEFQDWGGESDDLYSTRLIINGNRHPVAFGLKGRATTGKLTPKKMGKNGDQIQRLFGASAEILFVLYQGQIDESIVKQMEGFAIAKSVTEAKRIYYGIIDEKDVARLIRAYPTAFS